MLLMNHTIDTTAASTVSGMSPSAINARRPSGDDASIDRQGAVRIAGETALWLIIGVALGFGVLAAITPLAAVEQIRVLAALAAGFGMVHLWLTFDQSNRLAMLGSVVAGSCILLLALNALPAHPALIGVAYFLGALASFAGTERANPVLLITGSGMAVLALLGP